MRVRELSEDEARRLQRIIRRGHDYSVVTWRRATVVLASAQGQKVSVIAKLVQTSEDRVREMIRNFNESGMDSLFPRWSEGRPATFTPKVRARICRIARQRPEKFGLPFTTWSVAKLRDYLIKHRVVKAISKERLRQILTEEGITFQKTKSWKESPDPEKEDKLAAVEEVMESCPDRVFAFDELGPLNLVPTAGVCWSDRKRPQRLPANYHKFSGVRQFFACYHIGQDQLWGRMEKKKGRRPTLRALKSIRERIPKRKRIYVILDNLNYHTGKDIRQWADENNVELLFTPTYASWANPIECHLGGIRHFVLKN